MFVACDDVVDFLDRRSPPKVGEDGKLSPEGYKDYDLLHLWLDRLAEGVSPYNLCYRDILGLSESAPDGEPASLHATDVPGGGEEDDGTAECPSDTKGSGGLESAAPGGDDKDSDEGQDEREKIPEGHGISEDPSALSLDQKSLNSRLLVTVGRLGRLHQRKVYEQARRTVEYYEQCPDLEAVALLSRAPKRPADTSLDLEVASLEHEILHTLNLYQTSEESGELGVGGIVERRPVAWYQKRRRMDE